MLGVSCALLMARSVLGVGFGSEMDFALGHGRLTSWVAISSALGSWLGVEVGAWLSVRAWVRLGRGRFTLSSLLGRVMARFGLSFGLALAPRQSSALPLVGLLPRSWFGSGFGSLLGALGLGLGSVSGRVSHHEPLGLGLAPLSASG